MATAVLRRPASRRRRQFAFQHVTTVGPMLPTDVLERVAAAERYIQTGDIIAITSRDKSGYTSHVGMAVRKPDGVHFMHATSQRSLGRKVILDERISRYLKGSSDHYGIIVYRPLDLR